MTILSIGLMVAYASAETRSTTQELDNSASATSPVAKANLDKTKGFITDFERAKSEAAAFKQPILALFTGSDWCPWCKKLQKEVFSTEIFKEFAAANLVLFEADFPLEKTLPAGLQKQNKALAEKFDVVGFPTVLLLDASGVVKGKTGYRPGGVEEYVKELKGVLELGQGQAATSEPLVCGYTPKQRLDYQAIAPGGVEALLGLEKYVRQSGLEDNLLDLVKARASQINGCAYCLDMHTKDARAIGESEQRLFLLPVWRDAPCYTDRERAALAWTEQITKISQTDIPDELYAEVRRYFSEKELVDLTFAIISINAWNRLAISTRAPVGTYQPANQAQ